VTSWALAFYLTFELNKIRSPDLIRYTQSLKNTTDPVKRFTEYVGSPVGEFETAFHDYVRRLRSSGAVVSGRER
jgi:hypothetical protein